MLSLLTLNFWGDKSSSDDENEKISNAVYISYSVEDLTKLFKYERIK